MPHRRGIKDALDPRAESLLGRMAIAGAVSEWQHQAGMKYRAVVEAYREIIRAPRLISCRLDRVPGWDDISTDECIKRKRDYDSAFETLASTGQRELRAVGDVAVHDRIASYGLDYLQTGLSVLASHFGFGPRWQLNRQN